MKDKAQKPRSIDRDLSALAARSRLHPLSLERTIQSLSRKRERNKEERFMGWNFLKGHGRLAATAAATLAVAAALLVVPVSYDKVVGHEVALSVDGAGLGQESVRGIAGEFKEALHADGVGVDAAMDNGRMIYTFTAKTPEKGAEAVAESFARALDARGISAAAASSPIKERVSGNVYAMAANSVVAISIDGKSEEELETEIANQLAAAGIDADVNVNIQGDDCMEVDIRAEVEGDGTELPAEPQIVLTSDGAPLAGQMETAAVRVKMTEDQRNNSLVVEVEDGDQTYAATVQDPGSLSDAQLADQVHQLLAAQGKEFSVSAEDGRIQVMKPAFSGENAVRKTSWGKLKQKMSENN